MTTLNKDVINRHVCDWFVSVQRRQKHHKFGLFETNNNKYREERNKQHYQKVLLFTCSQVWKIMTSRYVFLIYAFF